MREIKFRVWVKQRKSMYEVLQMDFKNNIAMILDEHYYYKDNVTLMQYAECKDKYEKEIYEGDIVKFEYGEFYFFEVSFSYGEWSLWTRDEECPPNSQGQTLYGPLRSLCKECHIVGNIHENPELLKYIKGD